MRLACMALLGSLVLGGTGCQDGSLDVKDADAKALGVSARAVQAGDTCVSFQRGSGGDVADAKISNRQPDKRFGEEPVASVSSVNGHQEQVLLRFDTGGIPRDATLTSATLTLWQTNSGRPTSLRAHAVTRPWQEASVTWKGFGSAHAPEVAASLEAPGPAHPAARTLDVSSLVAAWVKQPESNHGLLLAQSEGKTLLDTSESPHLERRPRLEVCYSLASPPPVGTEPEGTSLLLQVVDASGQPVAGAAVASGQALFPTDTSGHLLLEDLQPGRFFARVDALGFTSASVVVELGEGVHAGHQVKLLPRGNPLPFQAEVGGIIQTPSVRVSVPANAVVDALGQPVTGTVEVTVAPLDPTTQLGSRPGPLEGTAAADGGTVQLESFFMAEVSLWSNGAPVQLAPGATATLEFVLPDALASQLQVGDTVPAWWFDLDAGLWREEGVGTIQDSATQPGRRVWVVEVKHFTWWNCDAPWTDKSCVDVLVVDGQGRPVANAQVEAEGVSYSGASRPAYTGTSGHACVEIKRSHTANVFVGDRAGPARLQVTGTSTAATCGGGTCTPVTLVVPDIICSPGAYEDCPYSGPAGTLGQGLCRASQRRCDVHGTQWSACAGEVLPVAETCQSPFDDDCDGMVNETCSCSEQEGSTCYGGPAGTQGVGICRGGSVGCDLFGNAACVGQQLPRTEDCSTLADDDCDGSNECTPVTQWVWSANSLTCSGQASMEGSALDAEGNMLVMGTVYGTVDFGITSLTATSWEGTLYVAKLSPSGQPLWARSLQGQGSAALRFIAVDGAGNAVVAGTFYGSLGLEELSLTSGSGSSPFVMKLSPKGELLWGQSFPATQGAAVMGLGVNAAGEVALLGMFKGLLHLGDVDHVSSGSYPELYVAKLEATTGQPVWSRAFQSLGAFSEGLDLGVDASGNVLLTGAYYEPLVLDGQQLDPSWMGPDTFLVKLEARTGVALWLRANRQDESVDLETRVHVDAADNVYVVAAVPPMAFRLTKFNPQGEVLWSRVHGSSAGWAYLPVGGMRLAVDGAGTVLLSGLFYGSMSFGGASYDSFEENIFLAWYDERGEYLTDKVYLPPTGTYGEPLGRISGAGAFIDAAGHVVLGGSYWGTMDFGAGPLQACGRLPFVLKLDPTP